MSEKKKTKLPRFVNQYVEEDSRPQGRLTKQKVNPRTHSHYKNNAVIPDNDSDDKFLATNIFR